jgi:hypothetical protein
MFLSRRGVIAAAAAALTFISLLDLASPAAAQFV